MPTLVILGQTTREYVLRLIWRKNGLLAFQWHSRSLHCALSLAAQCIVIGPVCGGVCLWVFLWRAGGVRTLLQPARAQFLRLSERFFSLEVGTDTYDFLFLIHITMGLPRTVFEVIIIIKRRFRWKIAVFPHHCVFNATAEGFPLGFCNGAGVLKKPEGCPCYTVGKVWRYVQVIHSFRHNTTAFYGRTDRRNS